MLRLTGSEGTTGAEGGALRTAAAAAFAVSVGDGRRGDADDPAGAFRAGAAEDAAFLPRAEVTRLEEPLALPVVFLDVGASAAVSADG